MSRGMRGALEEETQKRRTCPPNFLGIKGNNGRISPSPLNFFVESNRLLTLNSPKKSFVMQGALKKKVTDLDVYIFFPWLFF
jgi:hypothetical protein